MLQVSTRTETFTDLSLSISSDDNVRYINTRLSCTSLVVYKDQPHSHIFVSRSWLWWIVSKIFRQVIDSICFLRFCPSAKLLSHLAALQWSYVGHDKGIAAVLAALVTVSLESDCGSASKNLHARSLLQLLLQAFLTPDLLQS